MSETGLACAKASPIPLESNVKLTNVDFFLDDSDKLFLDITSTKDLLESYYISQILDLK